MFVIFPENTLFYQEESGLRLHYVFCTALNWEDDSAFFDKDHTQCLNPLEVEKTVQEHLAANAPCGKSTLR